MHMVEDMILFGLGVEIQVNDLLGVPPVTEYFRDTDYVYWLGQERGGFWYRLGMACAQVQRGMWSQRLPRVNRLAWRTLARHDMLFHISERSEHQQI